MGEKTSRLIGSVALRVARRAPRAVARDTLPPLFRDASRGRRPETSNPNPNPNPNPKSNPTRRTTRLTTRRRRVRRRVAEEEEDDFSQRDVLRREMLRPAVLRAARVALGDDFYAASIRDARVFACLRPGVSAKTARAAAAALEAEASPSETPLPVAVREIFSKGLMRRLR